jgi:DNA modification methylase
MERTPFVLHQGDCIDVMRGMADASVDAIVTDPPYELGFMGKSWDSTGIANSVAMWREALRVLKPGGHLLAFSGSRTYHRMVVAIEDAGFEIRDQIMWVYGSGFPKSLDVSKAIDKARSEDVEPVRVVCRAVRAAMDARGLKSRDLVQHFGECNPRLIDHWAARDTDSQPSMPTWEQWETLRGLFPELAEMDAEAWRLNGRKGSPGEAWQSAEIVGQHEGQTPGFGEHRFNVRDTSIREPSEAAREWQGWGTALKPAHEPIVVARKPLIGTVAENVLAHGTGALNIDDCRIGDTRGVPASHSSSASVVGATGISGKRLDSELNPNIGRWPANVIHDGSNEVVAMFPEASGQSGAVTGEEPSSKTNAVYGEFNGRPASQPRGDMGSAARFFKECPWDDEPSSAPTARSNFSLRDALAASVQSAAAIWPNLVGIVSSDWTAPSMAVTQSELRALQLCVIETMLSFEGAFSLAQQQERRIPNGSLVSVAARRGPTVTTTITASLSRSDGFVGAVTFSITPTSMDRGDLVCRFEYCAKTSSEDRHEGLPLPGPQFSKGSTLRDAENLGTARKGNFHPTVKPTELMRYLCRLVTPPGGLVLDPFMGSGSTGKAAVLEGFRFIGIDLDPAHVAIAQARIDFARRQGHQPSLLEAA